MDFSLNIWKSIDTSRLYTNIGLGIQKCAFNSMIRKTLIAIALAIVIKDRISRNLIGFIIRKILEYLTMYTYYHHVFATKNTNKDF